MPQTAPTPRLPYPVWWSEGEMELLGYSLERLSAELATRRLSARELTEAYLQQIQENEPRIGAYLTVDGDGALAAADAVDARRAAGEELHPLAGIPMAVKDNLVTAGLRTTCASRMLEHFVPPYDATAVAKLRAVGAIVLGKTNMDEFGMGSTCENSALGTTRNPLDTARVAGGSSGGSAAAVAALEAAFALGSDTGGSVRQPAAYCGLVGLRPTRGLVSRYGLVGYAPSFDTVGPITRTVRDNATVLAAIAGADAHDATANPPICDDFSGDIGKGVRGLSLALPRESLAGLSPDVRAALDAAVRQLTTLGARVKEVAMPSLSHAISAYYVLASAEASSTLARFDGVRYGHRAEACGDIDTLYRQSRREGLGEEVKRRILLGTYVLSKEAYHRYDQKARIAASKLRAEALSLLSRFDAILTPTAPTVAPLLGEKHDTVVKYYCDDMLTVPAALASLPALSLPYRTSKGTLPAGLQLTGAPFAEKLLYRIAAALEESGVTV